MYILYNLCLYHSSVHLTYIFLWGRHLVWGCSGQLVKGTASNFQLPLWESKAIQSQTNRNWINLFSPKNLKCFLPICISWNNHSGFSPSSFRLCFYTVVYYWGQIRNIRLLKINVQKGRMFQFTMCIFSCFSPPIIPPIV